MAVWLSCIWGSDTDDVYILYDDFSLTAQRLTSAPPYDETELLKGAFGYLWLTNETLNGRLGQPEASERVAADFIVQDFERGTVLYYRDDNQTYILFLEEGRWVTESP